MSDGSARGEGPHKENSKTAFRLGYPSVLLLDGKVFEQPPHWTPSLGTLRGDAHGSSNPPFSCNLERMAQDIQKLSKLSPTEVMMTRKEWRRRFLGGNDLITSVRECQVSLTDLRHAIEGIFEDN
jgi:hypothetical protein